MSPTNPLQLHGYPRADGRKGIRNVVVVAYLVECAHHVAREITLNFRQQQGDVEVHLVGFPGCYPNEYAERMMAAAASTGCPQRVSSSPAAKRRKGLSLIHI